MTPAPQDIQAAFCRVLVDEWARAGITEAVVAPGSRSTPLVLALDQDDRVRVHVVLDERSAGFVALGLGASSGRPAVVVTTSGTASVELHPAVVEASHGLVPMLAVTTDRPAELHQVGAPQTVPQDGLFGPSPRWSASPGVADLGAAWSWRSLASRCVLEATGSPAGPGPVHLNLAFREPLIGSADQVPEVESRPGGRPWHSAGVSVPASRPEPADQAPRGLVVAGHGAGGRPLLDAAARLGWPVLADPRSGCRLPAAGVVAAADALLRLDLESEWTPDVVVRAGAPWASKVLNQWLASLPVGTPQVLVDRRGRWLDPERRASRQVVADPAEFLSSIEPNVDPGWAARWAGAEAAAQVALDDLLRAGGELEMTEPAIAREVVAGVPDGGQLVVSSSMPVRDVEWYGRPREAVAVLANRGANGIDGVVSTAVGAALAEGRPTVALLGDLAFLHDAGGLLWSPERDLSLTMVVVDNDGGGIFSFLPQASAFSRGQFERYWGTPHGLYLPAVARAYGIDAEEVRSRDRLAAVLSEAAKPGIRVAVVRTDREANVLAHDRLHAAVSAAVGGLA